MLNIFWPSICTIEYLKLNNHLTTNDLHMILQSAPHLHTLITDKIPTVVFDNLTSVNFPQLTSLTIENLDKTIDELQLFLSLTPSLTYLQIVGETKMMDGKRWEQFIEKHLSHLTKFEFYFTEWIWTTKTPEQVKLIIASFQSLFWIEQKKWFVTCEYSKEHSNSIHLSTLPFCKSSTYYVPSWEKVSMSTYPLMTNNSLPMADTINLLGLPLNKSIAADIQERKATTDQPLFPRVTDVNLGFEKDWPFLSFQLLSVFIDISRINYIRLYSDYLNEYNQDTWMDIGIFMEQAHHLSSLNIQGDFYGNSVGSMLENMYLTLPRHIKHLEIIINDLNQLKMIFHRCEHLSTIKLHYKELNWTKTVISWFSENFTDTTCQQSYKTIFVWLGKKTRVLSNGNPE